MQRPHLLLFAAKLMYCLAPINPCWWCADDFQEGYCSSSTTLVTCWGNSGAAWPQSSPDGVLVDLRYRGNPALWAIEMLNEPTCHDMQLTEYYNQAYAAIRSVNSQVYIVASPCVAGQVGAPAELGRGCRGECFAGVASVAGVHPAQKAPALTCCWLKED